MALPKEIIEQIQKEAEKRYPYPLLKIDGSWREDEEISYQKKAYIAGATAWAEKMGEATEVLNEVRAFINNSKNWCFIQTSEFNNETVVCKDDIEEIVSKTIEKLKSNEPE